MKNNEEMQHVVVQDVKLHIEYGLQSILRLTDPNYIYQIETTDQLLWSRASLFTLTKTYPWSSINKQTRSATVCNHIYVTVIHTNKKLMFC